MSATADTTIDHQSIRTWVEERGGVPATAPGTDTVGEPGVLRIDFRKAGNGCLQHLDWADFFGIFEERRLAFLFQNETGDGKLSRFCRFVSRDAYGFEERAVPPEPREICASGERDVLACG